MWKIMRIIRAWQTIFLCLFVAVFHVLVAVPDSQASSCAGQQTCLSVVKSVVDGDTIELESGERVRYIGIDTPETGKSRQPAECFSQEATARNKELVEGKEARLEKDVSETDRYGRLLRYVYVGETFVNDELVRGGYAQAASFPPDIKLQEQFRSAQQEARDQKSGLWAEGACKKNIKNRKGNEAADELDQLLDDILDQLQRSDSNDDVSVILAIVFLILSTLGIYKRYQKKL